MNKLIFLPILALFAACTPFAKDMMPNKVSVKPSYGVHTCKSFDNIQEYKIEGNAEWNLK